MLKELTYNRPFKDEYPIYDKIARRFCPSARFVGGTSKYLCECPKPLECEGVKAMETLHGRKVKGV